MRIIKKETEVIIEGKEAEEEVEEEEEEAKEEVIKIKVNQKMKNGKIKMSKKSMIINHNIKHLNKKKTFKIN